MYNTYTDITMIVLLFPVQIMATAIFFFFYLPDTILKRELKRVYELEKKIQASKNLLIYLKYDKRNKSYCFILLLAICRKKFVMSIMANEAIFDDLSFIS